MKRSFLFERKINEIRQNKNWYRSDLVSSFHEMIPDFLHKETENFLDQRMQMIQRTLDIFFSVIALVVFSPVLFPVIILLKLTGEGEIFFPKKKRVGKKR